MKNGKFIYNNILFYIGQLVYHNKFNYRGVIIDVDPQFMLPEAWYQRIAKSRPPKDQPWYRVLVHNSPQQTYVAQRNLTVDKCQEPINHPEIERYFSGFSDGKYNLGLRIN
jgi:heat shock protein HspQ